MTELSKATAKLHKAKRRLSEIEEKLEETGFLVCVYGYNRDVTLSQSAGFYMSKILKHLDDSEETKQERKLRRIKKKTQSLEQQIEDLEQWLE